MLIKTGYGYGRQKITSDSDIVSKFIMVIAFGSKNIRTFDSSFQLLFLTWSIVIFSTLQGEVWENETRIQGDQMPKLRKQQTLLCRAFDIRKNYQHHAARIISFMLCFDRNSEGAVSTFRDKLKNNKLITGVLVLPLIFFICSYLFQQLRLGTKELIKRIACIAAVRPMICSSAATSSMCMLLLIVSFQLFFM